MRRTLVALLSLLPLAFAARPAAALPVVYSVSMTGAQEIGGGDPDGTASGTISIDSTSGLISWSFTFQNIAAPTAMHIHGPNGPAGTNANIFVGLGVNTSGGAGTLIDSLTTDPANATAINANPTDFYMNIHNGDFPNGAIRGQLGTVLPEPGVAHLLAAALGLAALRRRAR